MLSSRSKPAAGGSGQRGMSLIEVILMLVVLGVVALPLYKLSVTNLKSEVKYFAIEKAGLDARTVSEQILADYGNSARGYAWVRTNWAGRSGTGISNKYHYAVTLSAEMVTATGMHYTEVTVTVSGTDLSRNLVLKSWITK
jgi:Tfp pilus assembly protein PilV